MVRVSSKILLSYLNRKIGRGAKSEKQLLLAGLPGEVTFKIISVDSKKLYLLEKKGHFVLESLGC